MRNLQAWRDKFQFPGNLLQDKPESFENFYRGSPLEALQKVSEVLAVYWELVRTTNSPVDWRCQHEYTETFGSTTDMPIESTAQDFTGEKLPVLEWFVMSNVDIWNCFDHR